MPRPPLSASPWPDEHRYSVRPDQELTATGAANILAGLFQGFITGGGASQSAANDRAGAQTQLVSLLVSGLTVLTAVALLPLFRDLPQAALGAIVIVAVRGFLRVAPLSRYWRLDRRSFWVATTALLGTLVFDLLPGLLIAVGLSLVWFIGAASRPAWPSSASSAEGGSATCWTIQRQPPSQGCCWSGRTGRCSSPTPTHSGWACSSCSARSRRRRGSWWST
jgi:MFS superfamily sulfate permease-like transporter